MKSPSELHWSDLAIKTCDACGKRCYGSRKEARRLGRALYPGESLRAYQCGEFWHIGHTAPWRARGEWS